MLTENRGKQQRDYTTASCDATDASDDADDENNNQADGGCCKEEKSQIATARNR